MILTNKRIASTADPHIVVLFYCGFIIWNTCSFANGMMSSPCGSSVSIYCITFYHCTRCLLLYYPANVTIVLQNYRYLTFFEMFYNNVSLLSVRMLSFFEISFMILCVALYNSSVMHWIVVLYSICFMLL